MVRIVVNPPDNPDPCLLTALQFVDGCMASDASVIGLADQAGLDCADARKRLGADPFVLHLSGVISFIVSNPEAAKLFWAQALVQSPEFEAAAMALTDMIDADPHWSDPGAFIEVVSGGADNLIQYYSDRAKAAFEAGDIAKADHWGQRISAINNPGIAQLHDVETCRRDTADLEQSGRLTAAFDQVVGDYGTYWGDIDEAEIRSATAGYDKMPDRRQLADIVCATATATATVGSKASTGPTIMELGCFAGFNLQNVHRCLPASVQSQAMFLGIEPNAMACRAGAELSPAVTFIHGGHDDMIAGNLKLPAVIDICIISRVMMILAPSDVEKILGYLAGRVRTLVICDDIFNFDGEHPIIRMPPQFIIMHPFRQFLERAGFEISKMIQADVPDRECSGFIIAVDRREI